MRCVGFGLLASLGDEDQPHQTKQPQDHRRRLGDELGGAHRAGGNRLYVGRVDDSGEKGDVVYKAGKSTAAGVFCVPSNEELTRQIADRSTVPGSGQVSNPD